jgi:hypothetical protein
LPYELRFVHRAPVAATTSLGGPSDAYLSSCDTEHGPHNECREAGAALDLSLAVAHAVRRQHTCRNDMRIESLFDQALYGTGLKAPDILYHYTSWEAAENILRSQRFRASAHDCTNDSRELIAADATILDAARAIDATSSSSVVRRILRLFLKTYEDTRIGKLRRTYLVCFSQLRDDPTQWWEYGAKGQGVCLGLRLFDVPHPNIPELATTFLRLNTGNSSCATRLTRGTRSS